MTRPPRRILVPAAAALLLVAAALGLWLQMRAVADAARTGAAQARAGAQSLAAQNATAAAAQFASASRTFASAKRGLGPDWIAGAAGRIPWAGRQYTAARTLAEIGIDGSTAGMQLAEALRKAPETSATAAPAARFAVLFREGHANIQRALSSLLAAEKRAEGLSADGLVPQLAEAVRTVKATLRDAGPFLDRSEPLLRLESYLLSGEHRLLVISQDGAELRPTGGFPGTFGIVNVGEAGVRLDKYQNVYVLPDPPGLVTPPRGALMTSDFGFRDAGWWIDFPTSAKAMLGFWRTYRQPPVDGIIAIDTVAVKGLLAALGPIEVPSFGETFTSENLLERLLYLVEVKGQDHRTRKDVLSALATELETRVFEASPTDLAKSALALGKAADGKHVQLYFTDPGAQAAVDVLGWSGRVAPPDGTTDVLAVSNAMNWPAKVNIAMKKAIDYRVALQPDRSAATTLVLGYANTGSYPLPMPSTFRNWLRVYRVPGTVVPSTTPEGFRSITVLEFGFPADCRLFTLERGQSRTETLISRVPDALRADTTQTAASAGPAHYRLYVVRQDDLTDIPLKITVTAPPGWRVTGASARLTARGAGLPVTVEGGRARMSVPLSGDLVLDVRLVSR